MSKKEKILQAALDLFAKHGYAETSIAKITKVAGVSKSLTYTHFENKEALLKAVIEYSLGNITKEMLHVQTINLPDFLSVYFQLLRSKKDVIRLCTILIIHPETPEAVKELLDQQQAGIIQLLETLLQEKFGDSSQLEARLLLATIDGISLEYTVNSDEQRLVAIEKYLIQKYQITPNS